MAVKVAINGFGRIGRLVYRALLEKNFFDGLIEVVAVNDLVGAENLAYLLKYDTVHGKLKSTIKAVDANTIEVDGKPIKALSMKVKPEELPWKDLGIDIVVESTGAFTKKIDAAGHIRAGAKKVIISAPSDEDVRTYLMGVNEAEYASEDLISNASCTTNCLAPVVHVLIKEGIGIEEGLMTTIHAYTADQELQDAPHRDFRRGRAAAANIVPTTSGAAKSMGEIFPDLKGKLTGMAFRVPVAVGSVIDLTFRTTRDTSLEEINKLMKNASETYLKGILEYTEDPVVSSDFTHDTYSSTYDASASIELNPRFFKLVAWYDNEWGYSNRMAELIETVVKNSNL
ncbi:type I glyceraldehyde-3-phosphate dehydrogenase [Candidatus Dojkabacteria bacterium]|nr:type I glyceraldehyde-3-phosphate dehydrogenase [Candidatus Dojkabacteria bacterium]